MKINEIREIAKKYEGEYDIIAIRTQEVPFALGEMSHVSKVWDNGVETEYDLDGVSCTDIDGYAVKMHSEEHDAWSGYYYGDYQAIICGNDCVYGEDDGEVIIRDAIVVEILK